MAKMASAIPDCPIIAVAGSLTREIILETERIPKLGESVAGKSLSFKHAGKGANIAVAAYRASHKKPEPHGTTLGRDLGTTVDSDIRVFMNGAVGDDDVGPPLRNALGEQGIDVTGVHILPGKQTGQAVISLDIKARQSSQLGFKGANSLFQPRNENIECLTGDTNVKPDVLIAHCTMDLGTVKRMLEMAHRNSVVTFLNVSPAVQLEKALYPSITHIFLNEHEAAEVTNRLVTDFANLETAKGIAAEFVKLGVKFAIITLGEAGAVYATHDGKRGHIPAEKNVNVQDTTGAGDSFLGAYAVSFVYQKVTGKFDIEEAISFASKAAALTIESVGAQTSLPWSDQIKKC